jgi:hypothetical protein
MTLKQLKTLINSVEEKYNKEVIRAEVTKRKDSKLMITFHVADGRIVLKVDSL